MTTNELGPALAGIFAELTTGTHPSGGFVLNGGDPGLLASLEKLTAIEASRSSLGGAIVAAHAAHLAFGLSLMNRWATEGGNPFAGAKWYEAWQVTAVDEARWKAIKNELRKEALEWQEALRIPREVAEIELRGMLGSVAHAAYHLGAIRQILAEARGPKDHSHR